MAVQTALPLTMTSKQDGANLARPPFLSDATRTAITTEHLALIGFAARLGTTVNNDNNDVEDAKSVRDEAMLLMSLLMGKKASEILSEEIGVNEPGDKKENPRPTDRDMGNFSFTFPSLSLQPDANSHRAPGAGSSLSSSRRKKETAASLGDTQEEIGDLPLPSQLLGRPQSVHDKDDIRNSCEAMAHNVLESFGAALIWRAKTWIKCLARVLALKEQCHIVQPEQKNAAVLARGKQVSGSSANKENDKIEEPSHDKNPDDSTDLMNSREMQIIEAIVRSSEEVSVVNIKTSFRVMPTKIGGDTQDSETLPLGGLDEPAFKKLKNNSSLDGNKYTVRHNLAFEAIVSMTSYNGNRYKTVKLQAPGMIEGSFVRQGTMKGEETLTGISITLDTDSLALCLEQQSRYVVRQAAEAALLAASGMDHNPAYTNHSVISPRYVLMSPMQSQHCKSDQETDQQHQLLTASSAPAPSHLVNDGEPVARLKRVSPGTVSSSDDGSSECSAVATKIFPNQKESSASSPHSHSPSFPALLEVANAALNEEP